ncbi:hypothetical protein [Streptomyces sp. NBC_00455]|uniref:hypothetical protein n=1 Tax=Streptomyces sp. NBC_00455 TaxID=2903654 RepID=UPI002E1F67BD
MNTPAHFKQQLATELAARAASLPAPVQPAVDRGHARRLGVLAVGATAVALATAAVLVPRAADSHAPQSTADAPHATPSRSPGTTLDIVNADYAVKSASHGWVSVQLFTSRGVPGLQADLRKAGVPAAVMTPSASCHATIDTDHSRRGNVVKAMPPTRSHRAPDGGISQMINPGAIPQGEHLLFIARFAPGQVQALSVQLVHTIPACVA